MKTIVKIQLLLLILISFSLMNFTQKEVNFNNKKCLEGDCENGFGVMTYTENDNSYRYKGNFKAGEPEGYGVLYEINLRTNNFNKKELPAYIGYFKKGKKYGKDKGYALKLVTDTLEIDKYHNSRKSEEQIQLSDETAVSSYHFTFYKNMSSSTEVKKNTGVLHFLHYAVDGQAILIDKPFMADFGKCISGDCENGEGILRLENIGDFSATFLEGLPKYKGYLELATSEVIKVSFRKNSPIPSYFKTLKLPEGVSRMEMVKRRVWQLPKNGCLEGDCRKVGKRSYDSADRKSRNFNIKNGWAGYFEGNFSEKGDLKEGVLHTFSGKKLEGDFSKGLNGRFWVTDEEGVPNIWYLKSSKRVTKDGDPYLTIEESASKRHKPGTDRQKQAYKQVKEYASKLRTEYVPSVGGSVKLTRYYKKVIYPKELYWTIYGGNDYAFTVLTSDGARPTINLSLIEEVYNPANNTTTEKVVMKGKTGEAGTAFLTPNTKNKNGRQTFKVKIDIKDCNSSAYVAVVVYYKSQGNETKDSSNNEFEKHYFREYMKQQEQINESLENSKKQLEETQKKIDELKKDN